MFRGVIVSQFVEAFGSLLTTGVSVKESLALTEEVVQHSEFREMVRALRQAVDRGESIAGTLRGYRSLFPPLLTQMMSLGEKSGELGKMAVQIGRYIDKDLKRKVERVSSLIEPFVTVAMAGAIGTIAMAIYLPIFDMFKQPG
jgi:type IV pilus assembly protein PilC